MNIKIRDVAWLSMRQPLTKWQSNLNLYICPIIGFNNESESIPYGSCKMIPKKKQNLKLFINHDKWLNLFKNDEQIKIND